jgi:hypothetical protein
MKLLQFYFALLLVALVACAPVFENMVPGSLEGHIVELKNTFTQFGWADDEYAVQTFFVNLDAPARIQVTDFRNRGDRFQIYDNKVWIGVTSKVEELRDLRGVAERPEDAIGNLHFSQGVFGLSAGVHLIKIKATGPYHGGTGAIRLVV